MPSALEAILASSEHMTAPSVDEWKHGQLLQLPVAALMSYFQIVNTSKNSYTSTGRINITFVYF